mmetsp:Transcript_10819/g.37478  ORF Transcript_10819/g.37478 Transcript_10819/m.37478 type:complete len:285 (+) Transcript_10819:442-1296(+)
MRGRERPRGPKTQPQSRGRGGRIEARDPRHGRRRRGRFEPPTRLGPRGARVCGHGPLRRRVEAYIRRRGVRRRARRGPERPRRARGPHRTVVYFRGPSPEKLLLVTILRDLCVFVYTGPRRLENRRGRSACRSACHLGGSRRASYRLRSLRSSVAAVTMESSPSVALRFADEGKKRSRTAYSASRRTRSGFIFKSCWTSSRSLSRTCFFVAAASFGAAASLDAAPFVAASASPPTSRSPASAAASAAVSNCATSALESRFFDVALAKSCDVDSPCTPRATSRDS